MASVLAALIAFLLPFAALSPACAAAEDGPGTGIPSGDEILESVTTFRTIRAEVDVVGFQDYPGGERRYSGLIRNWTEIIYTGEVMQITGDSHDIHFFRDFDSAYILVHANHVVRIPGGKLSQRKFEVFETARSDLPEGLKHFGGRGIRVYRANGETDEYLVDSDGRTYQRFKAESAVPRYVKVTDLKVIGFPYVRLSDWASWYGYEHIAADQDLTRYEVFAVTPDEREGLVFDNLKIQRDHEGYRAFSEISVAGRDQVRKHSYQLMVVPRYHLSTVYQIFRLQAEADRAAFDEKLMMKIMNEDNTIGADRMLYVWATDQLGRTVGMVRLTQGYEAAGFISEDHRIPVERSHGHLDIRGKFPGEAVYEMNRLGIRKDLASFVNTKQLFSVMAQYMNVRNLPEGVIIFHTDDFGASFFPLLIDTIPVYGPGQTGDGTHVLSVSTKTFKEKVLSASPGGAPIRDLHHPENICSALLK